MAVIFLADRDSSDDIAAVMIEHFPHIVNLHANDDPERTRRKQAIVWCLREIGPGSQVVRRENALTWLRVDTDDCWMRYQTLFAFKDADTAFAFKMRWG